MYFEKKRIYEIVKSSKFEIPSFQRHYRWSEDNCKRLFDKVVEAADSGIRYYIGNVFYENLADSTTKRIFDGQQRTFSVFLLDLAFVSFGKLKKCEELETRFANFNLNQKELREKFSIDSTDADKFQVFIHKFCEYVSETKDFLPLKYFKDFADNIFAKNYLYFCKLIFEATNPSEDSSENEGTETLSQVDKLTKYYEAFKNIHVIEVSRLETDRSLSANKVFDCLNATGKPLTINDIFRSKIFLHCSELMSQVDSFTNKFNSSNNSKSKSELYDIEAFYNVYLKCLGHNISNVYANFEKEIDFLENVKKLDKKDAYKQFLTNMQFVYNFISIVKLDHSNIETIRNCFLQHDQHLVKTEHLKWIKTYIDGIALFPSSSTNPEVSLYLKYLEGVIGYKEFLKCLNHYWCAVMKNYLGSLYLTDRPKQISKLVMSLRPNNTGDFVSEFIAACENSVLNVLNRNNREDLSKLVDYLVSECDRVDSKKTDSILKETVYNKESTRMAYFLYLMLFTKLSNEFGLKYQCSRFYDRDNNYSKSLPSKKNILNGDDLGNLVLIPKDCEVPKGDERYSSLLFKAVHRDVQKLGNSSWDINETFLKARNKEMLIELMLILDFNFNSHLFN